MQEETNQNGDCNTEVDEYSCLFLSKFKLYRVYCPFQVVCKISNKDFNPGDKVMVTMVTFSNEKIVSFQVIGKLYPHFYFDYKPPTSLVITKLS